MCLDGEKNDRVAFQARADYQNHAIGWLHRGYSSLGGGKVVRFPRIWMVYAECRLKRLSEDVTEELEYVPGRFVVNRIVRPRVACVCCEQITQATLPSRPIERGRPGPGLLAHVVVSKYADHLPLYRQSQIFGRDGIELDRLTLADWVGQSARLLEPLADAIGRMCCADRRSSPTIRR